jgi:ribosomal protein S18 acetylase RimI-like enzyme
MDVFANILHRGAVEALAGSPIFARGERYFAEGRVRSLERTRGELRGVVDGTASYPCRIWVKGDSLAYHCECPYCQEDGAYCKHLVALALAWLGDGTRRSDTPAARRVLLHDRARVEAFLRHDVWLNIYQLGDLDDAFWPHTTWHARQQGGEVEALALLYTGLELPCLLALGADIAPLCQLLAEVAPLLPPRFYGHFTPGAEAAFEKTHRLEPHGRHLKMALCDPSRIADAAAQDAARLGPDDRDEVLAFYEASYPGHWFEPQLLDTGCYFGRRVDGKLVCVAGVHVYSPRQRVAALGNITTHPDQRGCGHARAVTARLCRHLADTTDHIGLNVKADNSAAIRCYESLGFEVAAEYDEQLATLAALPEQ